MESRERRESKQEKKGKERKGKGWDDGRMEGWNKK